MRGVKRRLQRITATTPERKVILVVYEGADTESATGAKITIRDTGITVEVVREEGSTFPEFEEKVREEAKQAISGAELGEPLVIADIEYWSHDGAE